MVHNAHAKLNKNNYTCLAVLAQKLGQSRQTTQLKNDNMRLINDVKMRALKPFFSCQRLTASHYRLFQFF